jgi:PAS domain S-box-containing protein
MKPDVSTESEVGRKHAEEALATSEAWTRALLEATADAIIAIDARGIIRTFNPAAERMFGYSAREVIGQNIKILMPPPHSEQHDEYIARYLATGEKRIIGVSREVVGLRKDGTIVLVDLSVAEARIGDQRVFVGIHRDITKLKQAEQTLAQSRGRIQAILEAAAEGIISINEWGIVQMINPAAERMFGYSLEEVVGKNVSMLMPSPYREEHDSYIGRYLATGEKKIIGIGREVAGLRKDGTIFPIDLSVAEVRLENWRGFVGMIRDITERKRAERERSQLAAIVESSDDAIIGKGLNGTIVSWNAGAERIYGYSAQEAKGRMISLIAPPDRPDEVPAILERIEHGGRVDHFETVRIGKEGRRIDVSLTVSPVRDATGKVIGASAIARDITEKKRAEEEGRAMTQQLWQAAKLASVGELAASVAHELNNPLATVSLRVEAVLARTSADDPRRRAMEIIEQEIKRMGELVANLLQFSRRGVEQITTLDVRQELTKAAELVDHHLRKRLIPVTREFAPDTPTINANRQKLRQVFLNLLTNASDAMPQGGTLTLRTAPATLPNSKPAVLIEVTDTGVGIPAEDLQRIMEPFFTTKEEGKGTGLGLAICRRVVQEHHGTIEIASEVGKGSTVRIVLPVKNDTNVDRLRSASLVE